MRPVYQRIAASLPVLLVSAIASLPPPAHAQAKDKTCQEPAGFAVLTSPLSPSKHAPLRIIVAADEPLDADLSLVAPDGTVALKVTERRGGPPYFWTADIAKPAPGSWQAALSGKVGSCETIKRKIIVKSSRPKRPGATRNSVWPVNGSWSRANENLYSAWIEKLFDVPLGQDASWRALHEVLRDRERNLLHNHLGLREDEQGLAIQPDCADLPYFLRAYFAFKLGLPFGYAKCTRGGKGKAPRCPSYWTIRNEEPPPKPARQQTQPAGDFFGLFQTPQQSQPIDRTAQRPSGLVPGFGFYLTTSIANGVHSGAGRTLAGDNKTDFYPVAMNDDLLRPGTLFADPYGHLLVVAKRFAQTSDRAGVLLAVDAQPDGTVAIKRFWRGNFLFANDPKLGGAGFKRFRPVVSKKGGTLRRLTNKEIAAHKHYGDFSLEQSKVSVEGFYDRMDDLISPEPLDPVRAILESITALEEQVRARVTSVENGRMFQSKNRGEVGIPEGYAIFETTGPWEDFATPSRDLRLLIAMDVVRKYTGRVARRPERYAMPSGMSISDVETKLDATLEKELSNRTFLYTRSDGSEWKLSLKDVLTRIKALEMAYNINDCVEHRWGAPKDSKEAKTCQRRASATQMKKMTQYRPWFEERRRPPRN